MNTKFIGMAAVVAGLTFGFAAPSFADTAVVANTGWQDDQIDAADTPSEGSAFTFTIAHGFTGSFALTDAYVPGDIYTVTLFGNPQGSSIFASFGDSYFNNALGDPTMTAAWDSTDYSHFIVLFGEGDYAFTVTGDGSGGVPAGFGYRLDTAAVGGGVPEPASWALMLGGFGLAGAALRRRRASLAAV